MRARQFLTFLKVRAAPAAVGFTLSGWLYLLLSPPTTAIPFGQRAVPSPLIWPAGAAISTMLLSCSQLAEWELRSGRRLWPLRLAAVVTMALANLAAATVLVPSFAAVPLLTWFAVLQSVALACSIIWGDRAWLPLAAVILVAMFELAQDGSPVLRAFDAAGTASLIVAATAVMALATIAASERAARRCRQ